MTDPIVRGQCQDSTRRVLANFGLRIQLTSGGVAFNDVKAEQVGQTFVSTDSSGNWSTTLVPNSRITPTGTYYTITDGYGDTVAFVVPDGPGPYDLKDILTVSPTSPTASLGVVRYDADQTSVLTLNQQSQARANIGAAAITDNGNGTWSVS